MQTTYIYGYHAVLALLKRIPDQVVKLYLQENRAKDVAIDIVAIANSNKIAIEIVSKEALYKLLSNDVNHQGVVVSVRDQTGMLESDLEQLLVKAAQPVLLLILDGVQDPHNLGACLRVANAVKADAVIIPKDNAVGITATVRKVACGAAELTPCITVTNLARTLGMLKELGIWLYGTAADAQHTIYQTDLTGNVALILGAEGTGLRQLTRKHCDFLVSIPMLGEVPSLNVSVAAGVCLFEVVRQRG